MRAYGTIQVPFLFCRKFADRKLRTVAVTPFKASSLDFAEVKRVCQDCTIAGFKAMYGAGPARPFRFIYFSAEGTPRDLTKKPYFMGEYRIMRVSAWTSRFPLSLARIVLILRAPFCRARRSTRYSLFPQSMKESRSASLILELSQTPQRG